MLRKGALGIPLHIFGRGPWHASARAHFFWLLLGISYGLFYLRLLQKKSH